MSLHHVQPFDFGRIFTSRTMKDSIHGEPAFDSEAELTTLRAELAALRAGNDVQLARSEGFAAGLAQARAEQSAAMLSAIDALHAGIESLDARYSETEQRLSGEAAEAALAAADLLAARALEAAPTEAINAAIGRALRQVARGTDLLVRVHPDLVVQVEQCIAERQAGDRRNLHLSVAEDASLPIGDARIEWEFGGLALDAAARRAAILAELETLLPPASDTAQ